MAQPVSSRIARYTTAHKLSVLRAQDAKIREALQSLEDQLSSLPDSRSKPDLLEGIQRRLNALQEISQFFPQPEQLHSIRNTETFLAVAQFDPGLGITQCVNWIHGLDSIIDQTVVQSRLAVLFCDVLQQWLDTDGHQQTDIKGLLLSQPSEPDEPSNERTYVDLRATLQGFLQNNGFSSEGFEQLQGIRNQATKFGQDTLKDTIKPDEVLRAMGRLSSDARWMTEEIRLQVKEEATKPIALAELASAFTLSIKNIDEWRWPVEGVVSRKQRHMNGKERVSLEMDVEISIFLDVVSVRWTDHLQLNLNPLRRSAAWPKSTILDPALSKLAESDIYKYISTGHDLQEQIGRWDAGLPSTGLRQYLLERQQGQLLQTVSSGMTTAYEGDQDDPDEASEPLQTDKVDFDPGWTAPARAAKTARAYSDVFKMLCADIKLLQMVNPKMDITAVHLDVKDFGPSMSHAVSLAVFEFFGAPPVWVKWLKTYLEIPILNAEGSVQKARKGTPFGQGFSSLVNELLLVILDLGVASRTGLTIHRNHDDFWFWSQDQEKVIQAWMVMQNFAELTGLEWNEEKSGCRVVSKDERARSTPASLPQTPFRWGYLLLEQTGEWKADDTLIISCLQDARAEIRSVRSLLGKINVWNKYQAFLLRNTSMPLKPNGIAHLERLQRVIGETQTRITDGESFLDWLKNELSKAFPDVASSGVPDAMYFWPLTLGGFELHSQLITMQTHIAVLSDHEYAHLPEARLKATSEEYRIRQKRWESPAMFKSLLKVGTCLDHHGLAKWASDVSAILAAEDWPQNAATVQPANFLAEADFLLCEVATNFRWQQAYESELVDVSTVVDKNAYREATSAIYDSSLREILGQSVRIVPSELVPTYALQDLQKAVKQLYK